MTRHLFIASLITLPALWVTGCDERNPPGPTPDTAVPLDGAMDSSVDSAQPDKLVPDKLVPDKLVPDLLVPDLPPPTCTDGKKNGAETDVDCGGGACPKCAGKKGCASGGDCLSGVCTSGKCAEATCTDKVKNGAETDVDCGGGTCPKCAYGEGCKAGGDCVTASCKSKVCACTTLDHCNKAFNCVTGKCVAARSSCASQKNTYSSSGDGVYWIGSGSSAVRVYCDMQLKSTLCSEVQGTRSGKTREGSKLNIKMVNRLLYSAGVCELWALRSSSGNYPIDTLRKVAGQTMSTCAALGFKANDKLNNCYFGATYKSNCGFPIGTKYYRWGNMCSGCTQYNGSHKTYRLQGYMNSASVITTYSGSKRSRCKVK